MYYEKLNPGQQAALDQILVWLKTPDQPFFLLQGFAGTGKTFCLQALLEKFKGRVIFTAPTNKATKVIRDTITTDDYRPECRTIYSLLGLRLEANGELKELKVPEDPIDLSEYKLIVVDEGSMINKLLLSHIETTAQDFNVKVLVMADFAQLPPVGEQASATKGIPLTTSLTKVMRHDNQILELVTRIRNVVDHPAPTVKLTTNNESAEGVWAEDKKALEARIMDAAGRGMFSEPGKAKAVAWRNVTVDRLNQIIRNKIFDQPQQPWLVDDRIILLEPAKNLEGDPIASTDDEGRVVAVSVDFHPLFPEMKVWQLSVILDDNKTISLRVLHEQSFRDFNTRVERLAAEARSDRKVWGKYWSFKEAFHKIRHAYAITAHRSQGSTYEEVYVDWRDILLNQNRQEAYRCLYVACSRPKKRLFLG